jgi:GT2 family glycosyltransferase
VSARAPKVDSSPLVSVVIPAFRSCEMIGSCLIGLRSQNFRDFEAIVVDSSPDCRTSELVAEAFPWVQLFRSTTRLLPHAARNQGFRSARGRFLVSLDPDCQPSADWLERLVKSLLDGHVVVGGAIECAERDWLTRGVHICKFSWLLAGGPAGPRGFLATANQAWTRDTWTANGPFSEPRWSADTELDWRIRQAGHELFFDPGAVVFHTHRTTMGRFWRERLSRGEDFARVRADFGHWSRARVTMYLAAMPLEPAVMLVRTLRHATRAGRLAEGIITSPVWLTGHLVWAVGEARAHAQMLISRNGTSTANFG